MRIAQVSPLFESVPPAATEAPSAWSLPHRGAGRSGARRDALCQRRFAHARPRWSGRASALCASIPSAGLLPHHIRQLELVARQAAAFDVLHFHTGFLHMPLARRLATPSVTTLHGRLDLPDLRPSSRSSATCRWSRFGRATRAAVPQLNWRGTVHHGLPADLLPFRPHAEDYLAFLGRISPEKRVDRAIAIATARWLQLRIAAKVDTADREYFAAPSSQCCRTPGVEFIGEIGEAEKAELLGRRTGVLFPIDWPEPFGMVVIEALACGTPVIAWRLRIGARTARRRRHRVHR